MDRHAVFRRSFHIISPIFLGYYLLPESLGGGITRTALSVVFVGTALCIEIARIALNIRLLGLRPYEGQRVSAYAQGLLGLAFGLFVIRDPRIVVPVFLGMAWVDPLAALCRRRGWPRFVPTAAYLVLFLSTVFLMKSFAIPNALLFSVAATAVAMAMEGPKFRQMDDDLLLQIVPMVVLYFLVAGFGTGLVAGDGDGDANVAVHIENSAPREGDPHGDDAVRMERKRRSFLCPRARGRTFFRPLK